MREIIHLQTQQREELIDITEQVRAIAAGSRIQDGLVALYAQGATAAIMIQENWDASVPLDMVACLQKLIPKGVWLHDRQDDNGDSHLKAGLVGPSETIPLIDGRLGLSRWQNVFFCEFDGPRAERSVVCTVLRDA
jgi:secondary thiamine-phosphate synthase enzyme